MHIRIHFIISCFIILMLIGMAIFPIRAGEIDDQLLIIREGYKDGLDEIVKSEARAFLKNYDSHQAAGEVALILGLILHKTGNIDEAKPKLVKAANSKDLSISTYANYILGQIEWNQKDYKNAASRFEMTSQNSLELDLATEATYWAALSYFHAEKPDECIRFFTSGLDHFSTDQLIKALYYRGLAFYQIQRYSDAISDLETVHSNGNPDFSSEAASQLAAIAFDQANYDLADLWAHRSLQLNPDTGKSDMIRGQIYFIKKNWSVSAEWFRAAASATMFSEEQRNEAEYLGAISQMHHFRQLQTEWWNPLVAYLTKYPSTKHQHEILTLLSQDALPSLPLNVIEYIASGFQWNPTQDCVSLSRLFMKAKSPDQALLWMVRHYMTSTQSSLTSEEMLFVVEMLTQSGDMEKALSELENFHAQEDHSETTSAMDLQKASLFFHTGQYEKAAGIYQQLIVEFPENKEKSTLLFWLAESYYRMEKWSLATGVFEQYLESASFSSELLELSIRRLILCHARLLEWDDTLKISERYIAEYNQNEHVGEVLYIMGAAAANIENYDQALDVLSKSLDHVTDPGMIEKIKSTMRQVEDSRQKIEKQPGV